ncbi:MAG: SDR family oxidoreductase, partial [Lewinella sp.]|nr:SDR family oxidoreductase [Lewinella sp.]
LTDCERKYQEHPQMRYAQPEEIANLAFYLLGLKSEWISGRVLAMDKGFSTNHPYVKTL